MNSALCPTAWRPVAHVAVRDDEHRDSIAEILRAARWAVIESRTGYHLVESIADTILGEQTWAQPRLVVVDAISPGCSGVSIARGLRDLGWSSPIVVLIRSPEQRALVTGTPDDRLYVVEPDLALPIIRQLATLPPRQTNGDPHPHDPRMATSGRPADAAERSRI